MIFIYKYLYTSMGNIHKNYGMKTAAFLHCITSLFRNKWISLKKKIKTRNLLKCSKSCF